jgi:predicted RNA-binding protein with PIN domain
MPYLIDGHNLIPKVGLRLESPDDEQQLIRMLQVFARLSRATIEVYFDGAPPGESRTRRFGRVNAQFVRIGWTADAAIIARLRQLGRAARNWTVVSSDREVQDGARLAKALIETADDFAARLRSLNSRAGAKAEGSPSAREPSLSQAEVNEWLKIFRKKD